MSNLPDAARIARDHARLLFGAPASPPEPGPPAPDAAALDLDTGPRRTAPPAGPSQSDPQTVLDYFENAMQARTGMRRPFLRP
jgi:hypothetical protein